MANVYWRLGGLKIGAAFIPFTRLDPDPAIEELLLGTGAGSAPSFAGVAKAGSMVSFTSPALATCLGLTGVNGAVLGGAVEVYAIQHNAVGVVSGSNHRKWAMTGGVARLVSIDAEREGEPAEISVELHGNYDGVNAGWVLTQGVAHPGAQTVDEAFFVGPTVVNDVQYCCEGCTFTAGGEMYKPACDGEVWSRLVAVKPAAPVLSHRSYDGVLHNAIGGMGSNQVDVVQYFRKAAEGNGLRVADATEEHISVTIASALATPQAAAGAWRSEVPFTVKFTGRDDGTNAVAAIDAATAIVLPE